MKTDMELQELTKIQRLDHDTLIRVEENIKGIAIDIKELKEGTAMTLANHESRIKKLETVVEVAKLETLVTDFQTLQRQVRDFVVTANAFRLLGGLIGGGIMFLLTQLPGIVKEFFGK